MNREVLAKYDDMSVGEAIGIDLAGTDNLVGEDRHELQPDFQLRCHPHWLHGRLQLTPATSA